DLLSASLSENPPAFTHELGVFREGFNAELDRLRKLRAEGRGWIVKFEKEQREATSIPSLKVKFNNVLGYFIEVTKTHLSKVPEHYIRRQTTTNAERFVTDALKSHEQELNSAEQNQRDLELRLFQELSESLRSYTIDLRRLSTNLCCLDVVSALSQTSDQEGFVRPQLDASRDLEINDGYHPVVSKLLEGKFVPNSLQLAQNGSALAIVTGPNMGGKSTFLRQAALIVIMAQIGCFVPARQARIGLVDKIFARIGASDDLAEGDSTFMVEMREVSHIISNASGRSLLLVDEVGRGTATTDGIAIAQALLEWLATKLKARTLFATHFHELTELSEEFPIITNLSVGAVDQDGEVLFTHEICKGAASRSYGIEVARLAGLPGGLLERARELLLSHISDFPVLESARNRSSSQQLSFFDQHSPAALPDDYQALKEISKALAEFDCDNSTPLEAMNFLNALCLKIREFGG
ncbi:MAG: DNA mismatch repair protein MutS, partial [Bdellovibrionales bacterium]|nr:DNA mismatch repair protein MutS [Bdellovibrionales bacterium]